MLKARALVSHQKISFKLMILDASVVCFITGLAWKHFSKVNMFKNFQTIRARALFKMIMLKSRALISH